MEQMALSYALSCSNTYSQILKIKHQGKRLKFVMLFYLAFFKSDRLPWGVDFHECSNIDAFTVLKRSLTLVGQSFHFKNPVVAQSEFRHYCGEFQELC